MKTTSIFITLTFLLLIATNIMGQEISKLVLDKIKPFKTMQGSTADIVQVLPGERIIEKSSLEGKTVLFCTEKSGKRTKIYEGNPVDYFSHSQNGNRICFSTGGDEFIIKDVNTLQEFRFPTLDHIYLSGFANISPDGNYIVFDKSERWPKENQSINDDLIVIKNLISKEERVIGKGVFPKWSPNSQQIIFGRADGYIGNWRSYLWIVNSDGTGLRKLMSSIHLGGWHIEWSFDGNRVMDSDREGNLRIVDVLKDEAVVIDVSRLGELPNTKKYFIKTAWSPDSKTILTQVQVDRAVTEENIDQEIFLISADGSKVEKIVITGLNAEEFHLWLNSNELLFRNNQLGNIWNKAILRSDEK
jgi:hypothetical protein